MKKSPSPVAAAVWCLQAPGETIEQMLPAGYSTSSFLLAGYAMLWLQPVIAATEHLHLTLPARQMKAFW